jgi:hypothetical protein
VIQIKIDVEEMKSGRVAVELQVGNSKARPMTKAESQVAAQLRDILAMIIADLACMIPGSSMAAGEEDIETLKGMENLDLDGDKT